MCGIFGFLGTTDCFIYGVEGLTQLRNRGYDSAGCSGIDSSGRFIVEKFAKTDNIDSLDALISKKSAFDGCKNGIFHTRWATHGGKTDNNAHPHLDNTKRFSLVHNGIIENYYELKQMLENNHNIKFKSDTDTEIIVNLISICYDQNIDSNQTKSVENAIMKAVTQLEGTWALVIQCIDRPDNIYCARHGSSLLIGITEYGAMITSEQSGFNGRVKNYICLHNGDISVIRNRNNKILFENHENYELRNITIKSNELTPEPFEHWTVKEIYEQYESSIRAISNGGRIVADDEVVFGGLRRHIEQLKIIDHLILLGCGTSLNAGQHAIHYYKDLCNFSTVYAFDGSEFTSYDIPKSGNTCAIFLSQSGETKDLYRCIKICKDNNVFTIGVINVIDSLIAREVDCGCYLNAGREVGVASTKAFTSQVIILSMIAIFFAQIHNINRTKRERYIKSLRSLPSDIKNVIDKNIEICKEVASYLITQHDMFILGKGSMLSVAHEGALKTKEIGYIHSEAYGGNVLRHGSYAIIEDGTPIIFINPDDDNFMLMNNIIEEVKSRNSYPIVISDAKNVSIHAKKIIYVDKNYIYRGVLHNIPMQIIAYFMAVLKGHNPDMPKNLSKCVSV